MSSGSGGHDDPVREDLVETIVSAGLLEEFIAWLGKRKGGHLDPLRLDDVETRHMVEFLREKNLIPQDLLSVVDLDQDPGEGVEGPEGGPRKERRTRRYKPT